jgi:hypothetical protein
MRNATDIVPYYKENLRDCLLNIAVDLS